MSDDEHTAGRPEDCLAGGGELGALMRAKDWSQTSLGPVASWPQSLRTAVSMMLSSGFAVVVAWGPEFIFLYNDRYRPILGATKHPMALGSRSADIFPEVWDFIGPLFRKTRDGQTVALDDVLIPLDRNGYLEECFFMLSYSPIRDESGGVGGMLAIVADTTERVQGERRLRTLRDLASIAPSAQTPQQACENAVRMLAQNPTDVPFALVFLVDEDGRQVRVACETGLEGDVGRNPELWPLAEAARAGRGTKASDLRDRFGILPGGTYPEATHTAIVLPLARPGIEHPYGYLVAGICPRRSLDDKYEGFFDLVAEHIVTGITNALAHETERKRAEALAEIDRAKTTFFSNVSHEFRTPLTLMLAPIEDMRALVARDDTERERVELLHRNALRLLKLVNTLLDFSRIEAGRAEAAYEPTDLATLTSDLASSFRSAVERAGLALVVECPPLSQAIYVDRDMWEKIVLNLLSNAFKFTFEGSIAVRQHEVDGGVELEVTDTGIGISEQELPRLFERFHRIEGARSRSHEGSGIGLALVQELVRSHAGELRVKSRPGEGSSFSLRLPYGTAHLPKDRVRAERTLQRTAVAAGAYVQEALRWVAAPEPDSTLSGRYTEGEPRERILVVDDNADMRDYVTRLLRGHWDVEAASDGRTALESIRRNPPVLVLADVMMPGLDGFALLRAMRSDASTREVPVIFLSARAGEEAAAEGLNAGADDYLVKPFIARELFVRVAANLAAVKARRDATAQRANLYSAFMQAPFPVAIFRGPKHVIEIANDAILRAWGKDSKVIGLPLLEALPEIRPQPFPEQLDLVYQTATTYEGRSQLARLPVGPAGQLEDHYYNYVYAPLIGAHRRVEGIMVCAFDVTEQVRAREQAEALTRELERTARTDEVVREELERASRAKDEFLATMSHELRTPLNAMLGWAKILKADHRDGAKLQRGLSVIERNALTQARLVDDLLDVSRIISGKLRLTLKRTGLATVIHAAADVVRPAAEAKRVRLLVDLDPDLGATVADPDRLQQIVWNLLSNAVRFTPAEGHVTLTGQRTGSVITLRIEDTGAGISSEHLPHIFERFRQVDSSTTRAHGGLGLGLAIVRHLVEAHGGTVAASSGGPGKGATFTVILPIRAVSTSDVDAAEVEEPAQTAVEATEAALGSTDIRQVRALVVDDDRDSLELLRMVLEGAGARVTTVANAADALVAQGPFDIIISDIGMPEMDGYSFMRRVRSRDSGGTVPAIALTAYARAEDAERAIRSGYQEHLAKPVDASRLLAAVKTWAAVGLRQKARD